MRDWEEYKSYNQNWAFLVGPVYYVPGRAGVNEINGSIVEYIKISCARMVKVSQVIT